MAHRNKTVSAAPRSTIASRAFSSTLFSASGKILRHGMIFITHIILMNFLHPSDFGLMRYVTVILGILTMINESGLSLAIIQKKSLPQTTISSVNLLNSIVCLFFYSIAALLAPAFAYFYHEPDLTALLRIGALSFLFNGVTLVHRAQLQRSLKFEKLAVIEVISGFLSMCCAVYSAKTGMGVWSLVIGVVSFQFFQSALLMFSTKHPGFSIVKFMDARRLIFFGLAIATQRIIGYLSMSVDYLIIGKRFGEEILGYYGIAYTLITLPSLIFGVIIGNILISYFSRIQDNSKLLVRAYLLLSQLLITCSYIILGITTVLAKELIQTVTFLRPSAQWAPTIPYIYLLMPLGFIYASYGFYNFLWIVKKKVTLSINYSIIGLIGIIIAVYSGSFYGMKGVCIALAIKALVMFPLTLYLNYKVFNCHPLHYINVIIPPLICTLLTGLVLYFINTALQNHLHSFYRVIILSTTGVGIYLLLIISIFKKQYMPVYDFIYRSIPDLVKLFSSNRHNS